MRTGVALVLALAAGLGGYLLGMSQAGLVYVPAALPVAAVVDGTAAAPANPAGAPTGTLAATVPTAPCPAPPQRASAEPIQDLTPPHRSTASPSSPAPRRSGPFLRGHSLERAPVGSEAVQDPLEGETPADPPPDGE